MPLSISLPAFVVAVLLISASPGPAMALILRRTALHGMRTAVPLVLGLELGLYLWALAAAAGFAALVAASAEAYWALKLIGVCVLVYLGVRAWVCIELCFYLTLAALVARAGAWFRRSTVRSRLEAISGTVLAGLGLRVGLSSR